MSRFDGKVACWTAGSRTGLDELFAGEQVEP